MPKMVRKQVYIEPRQDDLLKRQARSLGVTEAELIRRGLDAICRVPQLGLRDVQAWREAKALMEERLRLDVPQTGRAWTRDGLYDERLERLPR